MSQLMLSRRDVEFILFDWLGVEKFAHRPQYAGQDRDTWKTILDVYEQIALELFAPHNKKNDVQEPFVEDERVKLHPEVGQALAAFSEAGLMAAGMPEQVGGLGLPKCVERAGFAFLAAANPGTTAYATLTIANANLLIAHGGQDMVERYVRPMAEGRFLGTMCLSEPQAGSSLADIRTRAIPQADGRYRLVGNKMWISGGDHELSDNIIHLVLAKIPGPDGQPGAGVQGISLFAVPRWLVEGDGSRGERNDVVLAGLNHKMGYRGTVNCLLNFGEGRHRPGGQPGALGEIVGQPGQGLAYMFHMMNEARIAVGLGAAALGYTGYLHALEYARGRTQGRRRGERNPDARPVLLVEHVDVRRMLLAQKAYASGALALCLYAAKLSDDASSLTDDQARRDSGLLLDLLTPVVKSWPSQWGLAANDLAIQIHGGYGYTREYNVEQQYRDNRLNPIHEGTFGIQALDLLGRKVGLARGAGLELLSQRIEATADRAMRHPPTIRHAQALKTSLARVRSVTASLAALDDVEVRLANASAYLEAFGHLVVAWIWLDQALVATSDDDFDRGKRAACDYFFGWEVPKIDGWLQVLHPIERTPLETQPAWL